MKPSFFNCYDCSFDTETSNKLLLGNFAVLQKKEVYLHFKIEEITWGILYKNFMLTPGCLHEELKT